MPGPDIADVAVVGLGAFGAATLRALARRGVRAVGIDRHHPPHDRGSSHGETRITRLAVGEGAAYAPLVRRSHALWREIEAETGGTLLVQNGGLLMAPEDGAARHHGQADFVRLSIAVAERFGIAHEVLGARDIAARFPQFILRGNELGYYEPEAGMLFPERCIAAQLALATRDGAVLRLGETVHDIAETGAGVRLATSAGTVEAGAVVLCAGAWLPGLLGGRLAGQARVHRQALHWFVPEDASAWSPERCPVFIWMHGDAATDYLYGFPQIPGSAGVKVATEQYEVETTPETMAREVDAAESASMHRLHVAGFLRGLTPRVARAASCLYTVTPDAGFVVDRAPDHHRVHVVSACSGHGFKHSAALGEAIAEMALGEAAMPEAFRLARFAA